MNTIDTIINPADEEKLVISNSIYRAVINSYKHNDSVAPHYHSELEIIIPKNLKGFSYINGKAFEFENNKIHIIPPNAIHAFSIEPQEELNSILALQLRVEPLVSLIADLTGITEEEIFKNINKLSISQKEIRESIKEAILNLSSLITTTREERIIRSVSDIEKLFKIIKILFSGKTEIKTKSKIEEKHFIEKVITLIEENFAEKISLEYIAQETAISKHHLCRIFKVKTGMTLWNYIHKIRINKAQYFMKFKQMNISESAFASGFNSPSHFIKIFRGVHGCSPKQWLKGI